MAGTEHARPRINGVPANLPLEVRSWLMTKRRDNTRRAYSSDIRKLILLGPDDCPLYAFTVDDIVLAGELYDIRDPGPQSWNRALSAWKNYFDYACERDLCRANPARFLRSRAVDEKPMPCPSRDEIRQLWRTLNSRKVWASNDAIQRLIIMRNRAILALLTGCGLRANEICQLDAKDFTIDDRLMVVQRKGGRRKAAWWPESADRYLLPVVRHCNPEQPVFTGSREGRRLTPRGINRLLAQVCVGARIPVYTAHPFRRFAITDINDKHGIDRAKAFAGHARMSTTMLYDQKRFERQITGDLYDDEQLPPAG